MCLPACHDLPRLIDIPNSDEAICVADRHLFVVRTIGNARDITLAGLRRVFSRRIKSVPNVLKITVEPIETSASLTRKLSRCPCGV